jgi:hypothetical protein
MKRFPEFMKNQKNKIDPSQQNKKDIEGYYHETANGSQMALSIRRSPCHATAFQTL